MNIEPYFAVLSGFSASLGSVFGKLSGLEFDYYPWEVQWILKLVCFGLMISTNGLVWLFFVKALHRSQSSLKATVLSSASNFIFSGLFGYLCFNEVSTTIWLFGISLVIIGLLLIHSSGSHKKD